LKRAKAGKNGIKKAKKPKRTFGGQAKKNGKNSRIMHRGKDYPSKRNDGEKKRGFLVGHYRSVLEKTGLQGKRQKSPTKNRDESVQRGSFRVEGISSGAERRGRRRVKDKKNNRALGNQGDWEATVGRSSFTLGKPQRGRKYFRTGVRRQRETDVSKGAVAKQKGSGRRVTLKNDPTV